MPFWSNKPLSVVSSTPVSPRCIYTRETILDIADKELLGVIGLTYRRLDLVHKQGDINDLVRFLRQNYNFLDTHNRFEYTQDIIRHFIVGVDYVALMFYANGSPVGTVMSARRRLMYNGRRIDACENNFLAVTHEYRGKGVSTWMMNMLTKECVLKWPVECAMYTVAKTIGIPSYATKHVYFKPINIQLLVKCGLLGDFYARDEKPYSRDSRLTLLNYTDTDAGNLLTRLVNEYAKNNYAVYFHRGQNEIQDVLSNKAFYNFVFRSPTTGEITDFVSYFVVGLRNESGIICRCGYLGVHFFRTPFILDTLHRVHEYINTCDLFDIVTYIDPFGYTEKDYLEYGIIKGSSVLNYHAYNLHVNKVPPERVGVFTL